VSNVLPILREPHWTDALMRNARGVPLGNVSNVMHAVRNAPEWRGVLAYDEFAARVITQRAGAARQLPNGRTSTKPMLAHGFRNRGFRRPLARSGEPFGPLPAKPAFTLCATTWTHSSGTAR
jgi:hypothetical protein